MTNPSITHAACAACKHAASSHGYRSERWDYMPSDNTGDESRPGNRGCGSCKCERWASGYRIVAGRRAYIFAK